MRREEDPFEKHVDNAREIIDGLLAVPPRIAPKYFYDVRGSELFESITRLPEYYPTRTERAILMQHGEAIARSIGPGRTLIEFGAGSCEKARALCRLIRPPRFVAIDIAADYLRDGIRGVQEEFAGLEVHMVVGDLSGDVPLPAGLPEENRLLFYPGSSIGNFDPVKARELLARYRRLVAADGALLIGIDLPKAVDVLEAAYDDAAGVTAQFNLNILSHVNRVIGGDFDPRQWRHVAFYDEAASRIEMHLQANADVRVRWRGGERRFAGGERIHTENSYKYPLDEFLGMLAGAGFERARTWTDDRRWFAVILARP